MIYPGVVITAATVGAFSLMTVIALKLASIFQDGA